MEYRGGGGRNEGVWEPGAGVLARTREMRRGESWRSRVVVEEDLDSLMSGKLTRKLKREGMNWRGQVGENRSP